ncbi:MFS transporter [Sphingomonas sp. CGMCC 1.13654]|uniref:MFS transporter n=1 Tax=Sphingomonas chungangi TaxID=2683589 RepID=A0A838L4K8_9SPHN|nr:MFS transporter [Sphingomonas chungangi]MBA2933512.1 MFS transporter [Sphingomonas chungangi]MVW54845.1 MFS transporter [Sphingomonas chungangi]
MSGTDLPDAWTTTSPAISRPAATVSIDDLVDGQAIHARMIVLLAVAALAMISDGYDLSAIGYVGPELVKAWHISREALAPMFMVGVAGLLVGAPALGTLGDRIGRKRALLISLMLLGCASLLSAAAGSLRVLTALRFVTGVGLGGVIPNAIAFVSEMVPKRVRGRFLVASSLGVAAGVACPGLVTAGLVPRFGWPVLMVIGGLIPLTVAALAAGATPESVKYLIGRPERADELLAIAGRIRPDLAITTVDDLRTPSVASGERTGRGSPRRLLAGKLAAATPLIWWLNAANQFASFFALTWLPTLLQSRGASTAAAGLGGSLYSLGGLASGLLLLFVVDGLGVMPMAAFFVVGAPAVAAIGLSLPTASHGLVLMLAGLCVTGNNIVMNAVLGIVYPTSIRSAGVGWTQATGRLGAMAAPLAGGLLLSLRCSEQQLLLAPAVALVAGGCASLALAFICYRTFGGTRLGEFAASPAPEIPGGTRRLPLTP